MRQVFASGKPARKEFELSTAGGWRWFEARLAPELASSGPVGSVLVVCRDVTEQKGLLDVVKLLSSAQDLERVTQIVCGAARNLTQADGITFILRDGEHCYYADENALGPLWKGQRFPVSECVSGWCMVHRQSIAIVDIYADQRISADAYRSTFVKSLAIAPIRREAPVGAIGAYWSKKHAAAPGEIALLEAFADMAAVALTNVQLIRSLEHRADDNRHLYEQAQSEIRQREQAELDLREREAHFRAFFENVAVGAVQIDTAGRFVRVNDRYCSITGYSREELVGGMGPLDLNHPEDRESDRERIARFLAGETRIYDTQKRYVRKDGQVAWVHVSASTVNDDTGRPRYTAAIVDDITASKLLEDRLTDANQRFVDTLNSVSDLLVTFDASWRYTFLNEGAAQFTGHRVEDLLGQVIWDVFPQAVGMQFYREVTQAAATRSFRGFQTHYSDKQRWYEHRVYPAPYGVAIVSSDITDRKRADEAAHYLAALVESSQDAIIGKDLDGTITSWNKGAEHLYGYSAPEAIGRPITMLAPTDRVDEILGILRRLKQGKNVEQLETVRVRKDGKQIHVALTVSPIRNADQIVTGASAITRDITQRKQLEEQLRQAQKMEAVGQLAGGVAHDFNNLLTVISGYSEIVLNKLTKEAPLYPMLLAIRRAGDRASSLTRQLLAFSRKQVLQPVVLDLNALIHELEKMLRRLIAEDIDLLTALDPQLGKVRADPGQIEQVILNLAINARDAMPEGGRLTIETRNLELDASYAGTHADVSPGPYVQLAVTDEGCGMTPEVKARIFEPFYTTKEVGKGTGLGLATVHGIVKQTGGSIEVYSEPGLGTTFKVYLPRLDEVIAEVRSDSDNSKTSTGTDTILVAEDEESVRKLVTLTLESAGYRVLLAASGPEALAAAQQHSGPIHLLVTDVVMPQLSGRRLAEELAVLRSGLKVLYMSGYTDEAVVRHRVVESGMAFLQKPFSPTVLLRKVRELLDFATSSQEETRDSADGTIPEKL